MPRKFRTKKFHKRRTHKRKAHHRKRRTGRPTTSRQRQITTDRAFCKFKFVTLTSGAFAGTNGGPSAFNVRGLIPVGTGTSNIASPTTASQFIFASQYNISAGTPTVLTGFRLLPGNSVSLYSQLGIAGTAYYSDTYAQGFPTGIEQWNTFYSAYYCHGSAVEVTLLDCTYPGQLVVLPVPLDQPLAAGLVISSCNAYDYQVGSTTTNSANLQALVVGTALPDDQPYSKIKMVSATGGMDKVVLRHKMLTKKLYDKKNIIDDDLNQGKLAQAVTVNVSNYGIDPQINRWGWYIAWIPVNGIPSSTALAVIQCNMQVKITYFLEMTDRIQMTFAT